MSGAPSSRVLSDKKYYDKQRANETEEKAQARRADQAARQQKSRANETPGRRQRRLESVRARRRLNENTAMNSVTATNQSAAASPNHSANNQPSTNPLTMTDPSVRFDTDALGPSINDPEVMAAVEDERDYLKQSLANERALLTGIEEERKLAALRYNEEQKQAALRQNQRDRVLQIMSEGRSRYKTLTTIVVNGHRQVQTQVQNVGPSAELSQITQLREPMGPSAEASSPRRPTGIGAIIKSLSPKSKPKYPTVPVMLPWAGSDSDVPTELTFDKIDRNFMLDDHFSTLSDTQVKAIMHKWSTAILSGEESTGLTEMQVRTVYLKAAKTKRGRKQKTGSLISFVEQIHSLTKDA